MSDTGVPAVDTLVVWCAAAAALVGFAAVLWRLGRAVARVLARVDEFVDDWQGQPGRPGVPQRPGVMARLGGIEQRLSRVEHELQPNSGHSLRDAVNRIDDRTQQLTSDE